MICQIRFRNNYKLFTKETLTNYVKNFKVNVTKNTIPRRKQDKLQ